MPTPTSYVYTISTDIPSGLISVARLRREIELSSIVTQIDYVAGGITTPGNDTVTIWFKDPLPTGEKTSLTVVQAHLLRIRQLRVVCSTHIQAFRCLMTRRM